MWPCKEAQAQTPLDPARIPADPVFARAAAGQGGKKRVAIADKPRKKKNEAGLWDVGIHGRGARKRWVALGPYLDQRHSQGRHRGLAPGAHRRCPREKVSRPTSPALWPDRRPGSPLPRSRRLARHRGRLRRQGIFSLSLPGIFSVSFSLFVWLIRDAAA